MPVETRRGRQSTLAFPSRKTQTPSRTLLTLKGEEKNLAGLKKDHCRSKSLSSLSSRLIPVNREPSFTSLAGRLDGILSPRKRIVAAKESPVGSIRSPSKSPRKRSHTEHYNDENQHPEPCSPTKVKRSILDDLSSPTKSPSKRPESFVTPARKLTITRPDDECYSSAKKALHTSLPERLLCREKETQTIQSFLKNHLEARKPGSLYISGAPGTGKTACLKQILQQQKSSRRNTQHIFVNCMLVRQSQGIYNTVLKEVKQDVSTDKLSAKMAAKALQKAFASNGPTVLLVLDEIDHLDSKGQEVLYTMFEWPSLPKSRLVLVGVANSLDLTDRILPRLQSRPKCRPELLHFAPYTRTQISTILQDRLKESTVDGTAVVDPMAVQLCARKVAAVAGDVRKALDVCRRAVEIVQADVRRQSVLKPSGGSPRKALLSPIKSSPRKSPKKGSPSKPLKKVSLLQVSNVINEVYGSGVMTSAGGKGQSFPMQQKLVICTVLLMVKEGKSREVTLGKVHDTYCKICASRKVAPVDQSEFLSLCQLIETRGVLALKKSKDARQIKMCMKMNEKEVEFALQDKTLMSAILEAGLPSNKDKKGKKL
ncbi:cell division control protein 6 homolog [Strongylocentrotus purpuratus]|uniref:Cell division control protein n=1 Tax=Strongylocentrotus purpuratus TaxID=7668 RepID=A0A7M7PMC8_STRPU|nr:cell division control protein 6 homolog [Strongylocentrotus purpuratus]